MRSANGFIQRVEAYGKARALFQRGMGIVIACSGGPDSLALATALLKLRGWWKFRLVLAHFEHGIRGEVSREDARFVRDFAEKHDVAFAMESADIPRLSKEAGESLETVARERRYAFLERVRQSHGMDVIATAHHADDQAETVLMHILRGSGTHGLAGMRAKDTARHLIRPFLGVTRAEIEQFCRLARLQPRLDATNEIADCTRNRVRLEILPKLREVNPNLSASLCRLAEVAGEDEDALEAWASRISLPPSCKELQALPTAIGRLVLRRYWRETTGLAKDLPLEAVDRLYALARGDGHGGGQELPHHWAAYRRQGHIRLVRQKKDI